MQNPQTPETLEYAIPKKLDIAKMSGEEKAAYLNKLQDALQMQQRLLKRVQGKLHEQTAQRRSEKNLNLADTGAEIQELYQKIQAS